MAIGLKERNIWTLILVVIVGILIGSYLNSFVRSVIPGENNVVELFFTTNVTFGVGDFGNAQGITFGFEDPGSNKGASALNPLVIDLSAVKFLLGFQLRLSLLSIVGLALSLYFFRWYR